MTAKEKRATPGYNPTVNDCGAYINRRDGNGVLPCLQPAVRWCECWYDDAAVAGYTRPLCERHRRECPDGCTKIMTREQMLDYVARLRTEAQ